MDSSLLAHSSKINYRNLIQKSIDGEKVTEIHMTQKERFMVIAVPLTQIVNKEVTIWGYILTLTSADKNSLNYIETIKKTYEDYKQQSFLKIPVSANYYTTFLLISLSLIHI